MRASHQENIGGEGVSRVKANFQRIKWGPVENTSHDLGTDLFVQARDTRGFSRGLVVGVQVKTGPSYFERPLSRDGKLRAGGTGKEIGNISKSGLLTVCLICWFFTILIGILIGTSPTGCTSLPTLLCPQGRVARYSCRRRRPLIWSTSMICTLLRVNSGLLLFWRAPRFMVWREAYPRRGFCATHWWLRGWWHQIPTPGKTLRSAQHRGLLY